ncbi:MAG: BPTI/Kunitz-type proteinase inhibitor domain-containing protein [Flavobacteriales bacterium]|nr:BPTI/Kunitz-type proteinase inhibitor domain-containing protein [Flavobacteriales bacterium]
MKKLLITLIIFQCTFSFAQTDPLSPCQQAQLNATGLIGEFVPQCEDDGSYSSTQCWASTGYCWCVDEYGVEIPGTSIPSWQGTPDCSSNIDACTLSPEPGICFAAIQMYYFNQETQQCEDFTWGGCGGVVPFESLVECEAAACSQSLNDCCINPEWINPTAMCFALWDPVIGCDGIEYSNSCVAQASGITSWTDQSGMFSTLDWDCETGGVICTSWTDEEIYESGEWTNPNDPCDFGYCNEDGFFSGAIIDCPEWMGISCEGEWILEDGACCSICIENPNSDCGGILITVNNGWNMIGFSCSENTDAIEAFSSIQDKIVIAKDASGNAYLPSFNFNGIGDLERGYGYLLKVTEEINNYNICE